VQKFIVLLSWKSRFNTIDVFHSFGQLWDHAGYVSYFVVLFLEGFDVIQQHDHVVDAFNFHVQFTFDGNDLILNVFQFVKEIILDVILKMLDQIMVVFQDSLFKFSAIQMDQPEVVFVSDTFENFPDHES